MYSTRHVTQPLAWNHTNVTISSGAVTASFGSGSGPIHLDDVGCSGSESVLANCSYSSDTSDCSHSQDAGVRCRITSECDNNNNNNNITKHTMTIKH